MNISVSILEYFNNQEREKTSYGKNTRALKSFLKNKSKSKSRALS